MNNNTELLLNSLNWRSAIKSYDSSKKITDSHLEILSKSIQLAPTSFGLQPLKVFVISDETTKANLVASSYGQTQVKDCSHLYVFAIKKDYVINTEVDSYIDRISNQRNIEKTSLKEYESMMKGSLNNFDSKALNAWASKQVYLTLGFLLNAAALLNIDATPMEGFVNSEYDEILGLDKKGYQSIVICAAGFRDSADKYSKMPKVRKDLDAIVEYL